MARVVAFGDIHIGNINADLISFKELLRRAMSYSPDYVVLIGDVIDAMFKYRTQIFKNISFRPIDVQRIMFRKIIEPILRGRTKLVVIRGNHDVNFIEDFLEPALKDLKIPYEYRPYYILDSTLYIHFIHRRASGSYATAITPMLLHYALTYAKAYQVRRVVFGHIHRPAAQVTVEGYNIVALPSFLMRGDATDEFNPRCFALIEKDSCSFICDDRPKTYNYLAQVQIHNLIMMNEALIEIIRTQGPLL